VIPEIKNQGGKKMGAIFEYSETLAGEERKERRSGE